VGIKLRKSEFKFDLTIAFFLFAFLSGHFGRTSAFFNTWMLPLDESIKGTVHSHPDSVVLPSPADRWFFSKFGGFHLILGYPFGLDDFAAYDSDGNPVEVEVIP
jgi:proteasome lid subunit RPN8/RPN11